MIDLQTLVPFSIDSTLYDSILLRRDDVNSRSFLFFLTTLLYWKLKQSTVLSNQLQVYTFSNYL